jgi:enediyne biosynthesis protein E4
VPLEETGSGLGKAIVGRGSAFADIDGDGDPDVVLTQAGGPPLLLRNDQHLNHHWLRLKLVGTKCNRDAIGAWIHARVAGKTLSRQVMPTRSYLSQSELPATIGLSANDRIESLEVLWPGGQRQNVASVRIDGMTVIHQE